MRVVVNGWFWDQAHVGSGQYLAALAGVLPRSGAEHEFVLVQRPSDRATAALPQPWAAYTLPTPFDRVSGNLAKVWFEQVGFPFACRRLGADVAFVPYWGSPWFRPCPVVVTVHDLIPLLLPEYRGGATQRLYTRLVSATARRAAAVLTDSEASRRDIIHHLRIPPAKVHAVYLSASRCEGGEQAVDTEVRTRLGLPDGPFLLYLGGFDARKNVLRTINAFAKLVERCRGDGVEAPRLVVAGRLPEVHTAFAPDPQPLVAALGLAAQVQFLGWVNETDKAALYRMAAVVLFVSEHVGFGLPVLEAMACEA